MNVSKIVRQALNNITPALLKGETNVSKNARTQILSGLKREAVKHFAHKMFDEAKRLIPSLRASLSL